jgi:hypothetical protein
MPLSKWQRKERLGFGGVKAISDKLAVSPALVSLVVNDKAADTKLTRKVKVAVARKIGMPVAEVFGEGASLQKVG